MYFLLGSGDDLRGVVVVPTASFVLCLLRSDACGGRRAAPGHGREIAGKRELGRQNGRRAKETDASERSVRPVRPVPLSLLLHPAVVHDRRPPARDGGQRVFLAHTECVDRLPALRIAVHVRLHLSSFRGPDCATQEPLLQRAALLRGAPAALLLLVHVGDHTQQPIFFDILRV